MARRDGAVLMIDPWHRWSFLARGRAKLGRRDVERAAGEEGFRLVGQGGPLFWPLGDLYSNGERLLAPLGPDPWSDYRVLAFRAATRPA